MLSDLVNRRSCILVLRYFISRSPLRVLPGSAPSTTVGSRISAPSASNRSWSCHPHYVIKCPLTAVLVNQLQSAFGRLYLFIDPGACADLVSHYCLPADNVPGTLVGPVPIHPTKSCLLSTRCRRHRGLGLLSSWFAVQRRTDTTGRLQGFQPGTLLLPACVGPYLKDRDRDTRHLAAPWLGVSI
ncbi:hypothetical protein LZ30DRAFT_223197 [Colletotrichum cereale]|nr:hypothetical protein LZ30DRAFT_223197 [Colletotrichum cereale]